MSLFNNSPVGNVPPRTKPAGDIPRCRMQEYRAGSGVGGMPVYDIRIVKGEESIVFSTVRQNEGEALNQAREVLLREPRADAAEVWIGMRHIGTVRAHP